MQRYDKFFGKRNLSREKSSRDVFSAIHEAIGAIRPWSARFDSDVCDFSAPRGHEADIRIIIIKVCNYFLLPSRQINRKISAQKAIKATNKRIARKESKGSIKFSIRKYKLFFFFRITDGFPSVNKGRGQRIFRGSTCILHQNFRILICLIDAVCRRRQECDISPPRGGGAANCRPRDARSIPNA